MMKKVSLLTIFLVVGCVVNNALGLEHNKIKITVGLMEKYLNNKIEDENMVKELDKTIVVYLNQFSLPDRYRRLGFERRMNDAELSSKIIGNFETCSRQGINFIIVKDGTDKYFYHDDACEFARGYLNLKKEFCS